MSSIEKFQGIVSQRLNHLSAYIMTLARCPSCKFQTLEFLPLKWKQ